MDIFTEIDFGIAAKIEIGTLQNRFRSRAKMHQNPKSILDEHELGKIFGPNDDR